MRSARRGQPAFAFVFKLLVVFKRHLGQPLPRPTVPLTL